MTSSAAKKAPAGDYIVKDISLAEFGRNVSTLDGDEIRTHLSKCLGFSKDYCGTNIRLVGFVAGWVSQHVGTTLCSSIRPYCPARAQSRQQSTRYFSQVD